MNLRSKSGFMAALWDWEFLNDCFGGTRIRVTDIDGLVERNGKFLVIETKSPGKDIPRGQQILFDQMVETGIFVVLVIWGEPNAPKRAQFWGCEPMDADEEKIKSLVRRWYDYANNRHDNDR